MDEEEKDAILRKREESLENIRQDIKNKELNVLKKEEKAIKSKENSLVREEKYLQKRERKITEKERKIEFSNEAEIIEERTEKLISFLKEDKLLSSFLIISVISLLFSALVKIGITAFIGFFSPFIWFMLFIFSGLSALLVYFKQAKLSFYPILIWVALLAYNIRTLNLPYLRDITTGDWTLGPDLDPFLFLRWAKYIVAHGSIMLHDAMRYVPLGFDTNQELLLLPYMMAWFHKIAVSFGSTSVTQSAALFPAVMFFFTVIAFFFMVRKIFLSSSGETKANIIALISSFFLSVIPAMIPRTIAGIPEKESVGFGFMFLAFAMALSWGGYVFIFITIALTAFLAFVIGNVDFSKFQAYIIWIVSTAIITLTSTARYTLLGWVVSPSTGIAFIVAGIMAVHLIIFKTNLRRYAESGKLSRIPKPVFSMLISAILGIIFVSVAFGPSFILGEIGDIKGHLITPITDRLGVTVAENKQPFFGEWADSFGPAIKGIPLTFWLFFFGSVYLFWKMIKVFNRKERIITTLSYLIFLTCLIFSRYSSASTMNGTNALSIFVYALGFIVLIGTFGYYYFRYHRTREDSKLKEIEFGLLLIFSFFFLCIVGARGAIRLAMMVVPPASILVAFLVVEIFSDLKKVKEGSLRTMAWVLAILILISTIYAGYQFYVAANGMARGYAPSDYNQQWQKAMSWVRDNTPQDAVFGHWWDYGYWLQSIGERATVLDGGNAISYWDYLMGRHALTGQSDAEALDFLYSHNTTHFLIDSSDIGKYPAFSSIGSDENYDRYSWFNTFVKDTRQTQELKNSTVFVYSGGFPLDGDLIYNDNGTNIFIPAGSKSGIVAIIIERDNSKAITKNPIAVFVYQGKQYSIPIRYAYDSKLIDFGSGLKAGIFIMPYISQSSTGVSVDPQGTLLYLSDRTVQSQLARLYLYNEKDPYFKLVHSEDDSIVAQLKQNNITNSDIVYYQGIRGPIRIWEISYPKNMSVNPIYLQRDYPDQRLTIAR